PSRQRFAADKNLFNVLLTRARQKLHVVTALEAGEPGLIADFLDYAEHPPTPPRSSSVPQWAEDVAAELAAAGATVSTGYPVGRWTVDICLGDDADAVGLICGVHPDGPAAHVDRQRVLRQVGWRTRDVFPSRYAGNPTRAALDVLADFPHATGPSRSGQGDDKAHGRSLPQPGFDKGAARGTEWPRPDGAIRRPRPDTAHESWRPPRYESARHRAADARRRTRKRLENEAVQRARDTQHRSRPADTRHAARGHHAAAAHEGTWRPWPDKWCVAHVAPAARATSPRPPRRARCRPGNPPPPKRRTAIPRVPGSLPAGWHRPQRHPATVGRA